VGLRKWLDLSGSLKLGSCEMVLRCHREGPVPRSSVSAGVLPHWCSCTLINCYGFCNWCIASINNRAKLTAKTAYISPVLSLMFCENLITNHAPGLPKERVLFTKRHRMAEGSVLPWQDTGLSQADSGCQLLCDLEQVTSIHVSVSASIIWTLSKSQCIWILAADHII
jgi:hypothetical protein